MAGPLAAQNTSRASPEASRDVGTAGALAASGLRYVGDHDFAPYEFLGPDGQPRGFNIDLLRAIERQSGLDFQIELQSWQNAHTRLRQGQADLGAMVRTHARETRFRFADTHAGLELGFYRHASAPDPESITALRDKPVAVLENGVAAELLEALAVRAQIRMAPTSADALRLVQSGETPYALVSVPVAESVRSRERLHAVRQVERHAIPAAYGFATLPGREALVAQINQALLALHASGEFGRIRAEWFPPPDPLARLIARHRVTLSAVLGTLVLTLLATALWIRRLRGRLEAQTEDLRRNMVASKAQDLQRQLELEGEVQHRTADLRAAVNALESFSYSVSHDLKAPLRHLSGFTSLLREDIEDGQCGDETRRYVLRAQEAVHRMEAMIEGLLTLSRLGRCPLQPVGIDMRRMVEEVWSEVLGTSTLDSLRHPAKAIGGPRPALELGPLDTAMGDPALVRSIWQNLLGNAIKYSRHADSPRVQVHMTDDADGTRWFSVADNGVGFAIEHAGKLFQPFQRLHRDDEFEGTGIGLSLVRRVIDRHGGDIRVQAQPGLGARFDFRLGNPAADMGHAPMPRT